ncbi:hypothetical protein PV04_07955 [Phialophora macrospora]|uniref:Uncharacterized protein n=1 Tax=Phialophora macrospora TaxID=1851006 RepID=A0A0D2FCI1_9EURO|nr:hypothetical protein PV04_07955 [Phialophora macrospora]
MSTTAYQTSAKPRGRRGSHGETSERPARSRASSSASTKLSKTLSRTLDEVSIPRNSRPSSPAVYLYRQRTLDPRNSDPMAVSSRQSVLSSKSDRNIHPPSAGGASSTPVSPIKPRAYTVHDVHQFEVPDRGRRSASPTKQWRHSTTEAANKITESPALLPLQPPPPHSSHGLGWKTLSSRSLASMQPTVAEESEELAVTQVTPLSPKQSISTPRSTSIATTSARMSSSFFHEEDLAPSPRTSKSSLHDTASAPGARTPASSLHEPLAGAMLQGPTTLVQQEAATAYPGPPGSFFHDGVAVPVAQSSRSPLYETLVAPTPQGPVAFMQPRFDPHLAESVEGGVPVTASPAPAAEVMVFQDSIPPAQSPLASPPLSPFIHPPMGSPPPQPLHYAQPFPYQYTQPFMANFPPAFYPTPFTPPNAPFHYPGEIPRAGSAGAEDERARLLEKVSNVLPDIDRLLHVYQESQGLLSEKENLVKQAEAQHVEEIAKLRIELSACKEEYEKIIGEQAGENLRLKGEISEQREKIKLLQDECHAVTHAHEGLTELKIKCEKLAEEVDISRSINEKLLTEKKSRDDELQHLKNQIQEEQAQRGRHQAEKRKLEEELQNVKDQLEGERTRHEREQVESREAHEKEMARREEEHARSLHEHKVGLSKIQLDLAGMITKHTQQKKELDLARATIAEHERSLTEKAKELADTRRLHEAQLENSRRNGEVKAQQHNQEVNKWSKEMSQFLAEHEEEISKLRGVSKKELEQVRKFAAGRLSESTTKHEQREAQMREELAILHGQVEKLQDDLQAKCLELTQARKDHEKLQANHELTDKHHAQLAETMLSLRNKQAAWQRESERMDQILQNLRQLAPNNSKSDEFLSIPGTYR